MTTPTDVLFGLDLSNHQPGFNLAEAKKQGFEFVVVKCTEGNFYADPLYNDFRAQASAAGMLFAAYALIHAGNGAGQADWLAQHIGDKTVPVMVDFEPMSGSAPSMGDLRAFVRRARRLGMNVTLNYLPHWYWQQIGSPSLKNTPALIQSAYPNQAHGYASAVYPGNSHSAWAPQGGHTPIIWQFTDNGKLDGYAAGLDMDAFRGSRDELAALGLFKDYAPKVPKRPTPEKPDTTPTHGKPRRHRKPKPRRALYTVRRGDTLSTIANRHHTTWRRLVRMNRFRHPRLLLNPNVIKAGWKVWVPR